jgi:hypothetical protein
MELTRAAQIVKCCRAIFAGALSGSLPQVAASTEGWSLWDSGEWWMLLAAQSMAIGTVMVCALPPVWCILLHSSTQRCSCVSSRRARHIFH